MGETTGEITLNVEIADKTYEYDINEVWTKAITYTILPGYNVKYVFVNSNTITSVKDALTDSSLGWTECGISGKEYDFKPSNVGGYYLIAKMEDTDGRLVEIENPDGSYSRVYDSQYITITQKDTTAPKIIIENKNGKNTDPRQYTIEEGYTSTSISEKIIVENEEGGTDLDEDKFLYIFTQSASLPSESARWEKYDIPEAIVTKKITAEGTWYLYVKAADTASPPNESVEKRTYIVTKQTPTDSYDVNIVDTDGISKVYDIPRNGTITFKKQITVTSTEGNENLTIQYSFVKGDATSQGTPTWSTYTEGSTISKTVTYSQYGYYYLHIRVKDASGNVVCTKVQQYIFNGAMSIV